MNLNHYPPFVDEPQLTEDPGRDPQETAFLTSIVEDPDDDANRLVFADWLDDHGHADKAAFVRLEVEFSRLPHSDERFEAIRGELFRLDEAIGGRWSWALVRMGRLLNCGRTKTKDPVLRFAYECPNRWADLTPLPRPDERHCGKCRKDVHFCATKEEVEAHAAQGHCVAIGSRLALAIRDRYPGPAADDFFADGEIVMGEFNPSREPEPHVPPSPYRRWAEELFARQRKRWWQFWK
jgi:uncharacterized protein (TIGR02996 family)